MHHDYLRLHTDARATESARQVDSLAYTVGTNVVFRADTYAPDSMVPSCYCHWLPSNSS
jgi:hypothetical protein